MQHLQLFNSHTNHTLSMNKLIFAFILAGVAVTNSGCIKETTCTRKTVQSENAAMVAFATANNYNMVQHISGLYYEILNNGTGDTPMLSSIVSVKYEGKLLNGTVFDSQLTTPVTFNLSGLIQGWQIGLQLIKEGGIIRLIVPSSLAYGCVANGNIPPNSILFFEITLTDVQ